MKKINMKQMHKSALAALALAGVGLAAGVVFRPKVETASADSVGLSVFPANSRLSFLGKPDLTNTKAGSTMLYIDTTYDEAKAVYSTDSAMLQTGDMLYLGKTDGTGHKYQVSFVSGQTTGAQVPLNATIKDDDLDIAAVLYATMSGEIKVTYTAALDNTTNVGTTSKGKIQILVPTAGQSISADGIPDAGGFDFGEGASKASITAEDTSTFNSCTAEAANVLIGTTYYHSFTCTYTTKLTDKGQYTFRIKNLINPAPKWMEDKSNPGHSAAGRSIGSADAYVIRARQIEDTSTTDTTPKYVKEDQTYVGFSNGVKMTVRIMPQLTFKIAGLAKDSQHCGGVTPSVSSDAYTIDFGSIGNTYPTTAAQKFSVNTNAAHGYVITAIADDQMRVSGQTCPAKGEGYSYCIPGAPSSDEKTAAAWITGTAAGAKEGFGYTLHVVSGDDYLNENVGTPNVTAAFDYKDNQYWRSFADKQNGDNPIQVFNNLRSTSGDELEVCYQIQSSASNVPGTYVSTLTYTITASF